MGDSVVITDRYRVPVVAQKRTDTEKGIVLRGQFHHVLILSESELDRLVSSPATSHRGHAFSAIRPQNPPRAMSNCCGEVRSNSPAHMLI